MSTKLNMLGSVMDRKRDLRRSLKRRQLINRCDLQWWKWLNCKLLTRLQTSHFLQCCKVGSARNSADNRQDIFGYLWWRWPWALWHCPLLPVTYRQILQCSRGRENNQKRYRTLRWLTIERRESRERQQRIGLVADAMMGAPCQDWVYLLTYYKYDLNILSISLA